MLSEQILESFTLTIKEDVLISVINRRIAVDEFREMMQQGKTFALKRNIKKILVIATGVDFSNLSISERHEIGLAAAEIWGSRFRAVLLAEKPHINKHGENVANNRGAEILVTHDKEEAYSWLGIK